MEHRAVEVVRERLDAKPGKQRMRRHGPRTGRVQQHRAETPRIVVSKQALAEVDVDVVVPGRGRGGCLQDAQVARHTEMDEQRRLAEIEQQVLAASPDASQPAMAERGIEAGGHRPAQATLAHLDPADEAVRQAGLQAATNDFHLGQFGHRTWRDDVSGNLARQCN